MNPHHHYILEGREVIPVDLMTWANWLETAERTLARDKDEARNIAVSTVFIGLDHNFSDFGAPLIFETMVFGGEHDYYERRYSTYTEALAGHAEVMKMVGVSEVLEWEYIEC